jgi:D-beta-D-heptose 7-phosphate kinase/D-beta-D-heptose 1-phosphate adenosyltransferase
MTKIPDHFHDVNALIVGDIMLDRYYFGVTHRISPEAPVPVVAIDEERECPGGAGNVALNIAALGGKAKLIAFVGKDAAADSLERELKAVGVEPSFIRRDTPTIVKQRVLSQNQQLIRLDFETPFSPDPAAVMAHFQAQLSWANVVIISDYAKGVIGDDVKDLIALAKQKNIPVVVDPKRNDLSAYDGATLITPNFKEFQQVVGECKTESTVLDKGFELLDSNHFDALLVTRGAQGVTLLIHDEPAVYFPARGREVFDVTGAGDTVISTIAAALASGSQLYDAVELGNIAAGIVIGKLGAATVTLQEIAQECNGKQERRSGVQDEDGLQFALNEARAQGEKIVFTNGCFDVLHAMHVEYLEMAKQCGDRLVVAVNDDASISRLKGPDRPVNKLEQRMSVLAGLSAVDWVIPFSDDTPNRLLELIKPDVLAKGGDYTIDQVVGADVVCAYGGKAVVLGGVKEGVKSTAIIERMRQLKNDDS